MSGKRVKTIKLAGEVLVHPLADIERVNKSPAMFCQHRHLPRKRQQHGQRQSANDMLPKPRRSLDEGIQELLKGYLTITSPPHSLASACARTQ